jgi:hypothetical protein
LIAPVFMLPLATKSVWVCKIIIFQNTRHDHISSGRC